MLKRLLSAACFSLIAFSANAHEVGDFVYTKTAKYKITGANLVKNGTFTQGETGLDGWDTISVDYPVASVFQMIPQGGPNGTNSVQLISGQNALAAGMKQLVEVSEGGIYVVSFSVINGTAAGFTDLDMTGGSTNYMNAYWNTEGDLATVSGTTLYYGTNKNEVNTDGSFGTGVSGGYQFSYTTDSFTEATFAVEAPANGYIVIDFRGLAEGMEIANVSCHLAENVYDDRVAESRIAYIQKYLADGKLNEREYYEDVQETVNEVRAALEANATPDEMAVQMENLEGAWGEFVNVNFANVLDWVTPTSGSSITGNNSANWMNWTGKYNKLNSDYNGKAPWKWSTDRWCHKTAAANTAMRIQWMRGTAGPYNNIATLTTTLKPGTYYWGMSAKGGMMTLNKNRWACSWANECAATQLFFNGDTTEVFTLSAAVLNDYVCQWTLEEEKEVTLGIICNTSTAHTDGFDVEFYSPVLYRVLNEGELTPEQEAYLDGVQTQMETLQSRIDVANAYLSAENDTLPWGKEALQAGVAEVQALYDGWAAMTQEELLGMLEDDIMLADTITTYGVNHLNNDYITPFETLNVPLTDMPVAIALAETALAQRIYSSSAKKADLQNMIAESEALYKEKLLVAFSAADSAALADQKKALEQAVEEFKLAIDATTIVDIDFGTQAVPAVFVTYEATEEADAYYTVEGAKGFMTFSDITGGNCYSLGYNGADSLGMLCVGNSEAVVKFSGTPAKESDIVNITFDYYFGNLSGKYAGYKLLTEVGDTICGLYCSKYDKKVKLNTFDVNYTGMVVSTGSSSVSNAGIAASSNKTSFDLVLDYGAKTMYCTTVSSKGTATTETITLPEGLIPGQFVIYSDYSTAARRCWFDNLKVLNIAADPVTEGNGIGSVRVVKTQNGAMYNLMGQRITAPVKGQIYILNGKKMIGK